jgi:hypothetical protein
MPGIRLSEPFAIVVPLKAAFLKYDADQQMFHADGRMPIPDSMWEFLDHEIDTDYGGENETTYFLVLGNRTRSAFYEGMTANGLKGQVEKESGQMDTLHLEPEPGITGHLDPDPPPLHVPGTDAPAVKEELVVVLTGIASTPPLTVYRNEKPASVAQPTEYDVEVRRLNFHPAAAQIVRLDTGEVLARANYDRHGHATFIMPHRSMRKRNGHEKT